MLVGLFPARPGGARAVGRRLCPLVRLSLRQADALGPVELVDHFRKRRLFSRLAADPSFRVRFGLGSPCV